MLPTQRSASSGDAAAAGRGRQRLKIAAIGYFNVRHGVDASEDSARAARVFLCKRAVEFVEALPGNLLRGRRIDFLRPGADETLAYVAIAYAGSRNGIDADVGMAREGLALLCQASIDYVEAMPFEDLTKRAGNPLLQIGNGVNT